METGESNKKFNLNNELKLNKNIDSYNVKMYRTGKDVGLNIDYKFS